MGFTDVPQRLLCAWALTGHEGEQDILLHGAVAAEVIPGEKNEGFQSAGHLCMESCVIKNK